MPSTIKDLDEHLTVDLGWTSSSVAFGRQSWTIPTTLGRADINVRVEGDGIVGTFTLIEIHPSDEGEEPWDEETAKLDIGPIRDLGLSIHRSESEVVNALARYALILEARVEV